MCPSLFLSSLLAFKVLLSNFTFPRFVVYSRSWLFRSRVRKKLSDRFFLLLRQSREIFFLLRHSLLVVAVIFLTYLFVSSSSESLLFLCNVNLVSLASLSCTLRVFVVNARLAIRATLHPLFLLLRVFGAFHHFPSRCELSSSCLSLIVIRNCSPTFTFSVVDPYQVCQPSTAWPSFKTASAFAPPTLPWPRQMNPQVSSTRLAMAPCHISPRRQSLFVWCVCVLKSSSSVSCYPQGTTTQIFSIVGLHAS